MMNGRMMFAAALLSAMVLGACSDDQELVGINSDCSNLSGTYTATTATVTGTGTNGTVNLLADSSAFDVTFGVGAFSASFRPGANGTPVLVSGNLTTATATNITINQSLFPNGGSSNAFDCSINGNTLTLHAPKGTFTFAGQTDASDADVRLVLKRTSSL